MEGLYVLDSILSIQPVLIHSVFVARHLLGV